MQSVSMTYYEQLGIEQSAAEQEVHAAFRARMAEIRQRLSADANAVGEGECDDLRQAYAILSDPARRRAYDASLVDMMSPTVPIAPQLAGDKAAAASNEQQVQQEQQAEQAAWVPLRFVGKGGDYFRIWIVNLLLSIVTLGIYSAWAKVRREQFFHRNLLLDGSPFEYHGEAVAILNGRLLAVLILFLFSMSQKLGPIPYAIASVLLMLATPWLMVRALRFRAANSSYRGLRFGFSAGYGEACRLMLGYGLLSVVTLGLGFPLFYRRLRTFVIDHLRYGTTPFRCEVGVGEIYRIFVMPILAIFSFWMLLFFLVSMQAGQGAAAVARVGGGIFLGFLLLYLFIQAYLPARSANAVWTATHLGPHAMRCDLPFGGYFYLVATNWLLIVVTLGLAIPVARVRMATYRAEHFALQVSGSLDSLVGGAWEKLSALGEEGAEFLDIDVSL